MTWIIPIAVGGVILLGMRQTPWSTRILGALVASGLIAGALYVGAY